MKIKGLLLSFLLGSTLGLRAQVTVDATLDQDQFLPGEAMPLAVRITNRSGQSLELGKDQEWLTFNVEGAQGTVAMKTGEVPVEGEFTLGSSKRAIKRVDLAPYFSFPRPGHYTVSATVFIKEWNQSITSPPLGFDIIQGSKMWEQEVGLPKPPGADDGRPEIRKYVLHQANYLRKRLMLYVEITEPSGKIHKVFPIGPLLSFGQPEPQVDRLSNLHVLYQDGPKSCTYNVINPQGDILIRQKYDINDTTRPKLKVNASGHIEVVGGARRVTLADLPPPPPQPAETNAPTEHP